MTLNHVYSERNRQNATDIYSGDINGKNYRVQIDPVKEPKWIEGAVLNETERNEVLDAIDVREASYREPGEALDAWSGGFADNH